MELQGGGIQKPISGLCISRNAGERVGNVVLEGKSSHEKGENSKSPMEERGKGRPKKKPMLFQCLKRGSFSTSRDGRGTGSYH